MKNNLNITYLIVSFIIGLVVGMTLLSLSSIQSQQDHAHSTSLPHEHGAMEHGKIELLPENAPTVELEVLSDSKSGWNINIKTSNFEFSPENVNSEHVLGEGHAHLYIDDIKITRVYSNWYHIPELSKGEHNIKVTLNSNDHRDYTVLGEPIQSIKSIFVD